MPIFVHTHAYIQMLAFERPNYFICNTTSGYFATLTEHSTLTPLKHVHMSLQHLLPTKWFASRAVLARSGFIGWHQANSNAVMDETLAAARPMFIYHCAPLHAAPPNPRECPHPVVARGSATVEVSCTVCDLIWSECNTTLFSLCTCCSNQHLWS